MGSESNILNWALWYADNGLPVFPLHSIRGGRCSCGNAKCENAGKHPRTLHGFKDATTDPKQIKEWWGKWPDANIGIPTGSASGILLVDVDPRNGGEESLARLIAEHGPLPKTAQQITGGDGQHFCLKYPGGSVPKQLEPGIDLKGDGGYFAAAPSLHLSGRRYKWTGEGPEALLNLAEAPPWLLAYIAARHQSPSESPETSSRKLREPKETKIEGGHIGSGRRNTTLASLAGTMRARGMTPEAVEAALLKENERRCVPALPEEEVRKIAQSISSYPPSSASPQGSKQGKQNQSNLLIKLASGEDVELFHNPTGDAFATVQVNGHQQHYAVPSKAFRDVLLHRFLQIHDKSPGSQALNDAINTIAAKARLQGPEYRVFVRVAEHDGRIYLDLANKAWQAVEIDRRGWRVMSDPPVRSIRRRGMLPLPIPESGSSLQALRDFVNIGSDSDFVLLLAFLVMAIRPRGPYPLLGLHGAHGSAKSTTARLLRELIDPNSAALRSEPTDPQDLIIAATNSWVINLDNLSRLPVWLSDCLCRLSTGGGFGKRELYTDAEEALFDAQRPVIINGIEELATRGDLLDRAVILYLPQITAKDRQPEAAFWKDFEQLRPQLLGAVLDAVSMAVRNLPKVSLKSPPRMADFAEWGVAAEPAFGCETGTFLNAYQANRNAANQLALDASPVADVLKQLVSEGIVRAGVLHTFVPFEGTSTELLAILREVTQEEILRLSSWPKDGRALSNALRRLVPNLRGAGIDVRMPGAKPIWDAKRKGAGRIIEIRKIETP